MRKVITYIHMKTILFICHGNICRSVASEYIFKYLIKKKNLQNEYACFSRGTSNEEFGNDIYPPMKNELRKHNIPFDDHFARKVSVDELNRSDYIFFMDEYNYRNLMYIDSKNKFKYENITYLNNKIDHIDDPWYTGNFNKTFNEIYECINLIIKELKKNG